MVLEKAISKEKKTFQKQFIFLILVSVFALLLSFWNAADMLNGLMDSTQSYVKDASAQMADDISYTIYHKMMELANMADSLSNSDMNDDPESLMTFFAHKQKILEFDPVIMLDQTGKSVVTSYVSETLTFDPEKLLAMNGVKQSFDGKVRASYEADGRNVFYSAPVYNEQNKIEYILVGVRNKESIQKMISSKSFSNLNLSCLVDRFGNFVISPDDSGRFDNLEELFGSNKNNEKTLRTLLSSLEDRKSGIIKFTSAENKPKYLSYNPLSINDWMLLTIVPENLFSGNSDHYVTRSFFILAAISAIFLLFIAMLYRIYIHNQKNIAHYAFKDPLTGGLNNSGFQLEYDKLRPSIAPNTYSLIMYNLRGFKLINELFGTSAADRMLVHFYNVIAQHINPEDHELAARSEAGHFFILLKEHTLESIQKRLDVMIEEINAFRDVECPRHLVSFRSGACVISDTSTEMILLQDRAKFSIKYGTTDSPDKCVLYDDQIIENVKKEFELNELFQSSIDNCEFLVYLQPKINIKDNSVGGAEALVRWKHSKKGIIFPSDFIPIFERNGKICRLDLYMFEQVCILLNRWKNEGRKLYPISVNLSRQHFQNPDFLIPFAGLKEQYQIPDGLIELEITESTFFEMEQIKEVPKYLAEMHRLGFLCSLDDFGSGFSSLGLLKDFEVDVIKFDRSFFLNMTEKSKYVIASLAKLTKNLHLEIVAEGIEDEEQLEYLRSVDYDKIQGYIFSKPLPVDEFEKFCETFGNE